MTLNDSAIRSMAWLILCLASGCASAHPLAADAGSASDGASSADASMIPDADASLDAASAAHDASVDLPDLGSIGRCEVDSDCNDDLALSSVLGECIGGQCFCREGSWMQASGRCGTTAPTCAASGGTCRSSTDVGHWCLAVEGLRPIATTANEDCVARGAGDVCCIEETTCRRHPDFVDSCYVQGSDAAYVPPCTNGWLTCVPGDSPELRIGT